MQQASEGGDTTSPRPSRRAVSPITAALVIAALVGTALAYLFLTAPDSPKPAEQKIPAAAQAEEPEVLTEAEAIAEIKRLDSLRIRMYRTRNLSLLRDLVTSDSPLRKLLRKEIRLLRQENVLSRSTYRSKRFLIQSSSPNSIVIHQTFVYRPRVISEGGRDVTKDRRPLLNQTKWTLHLEEDTWKIFNSELLKSQKVK
jgi:hypothetical protein